MLSGRASHGTLPEAIEAAHDLLVAVADMEQRGQTVTISAFGEMFRRELWGLSAPAQNDLNSFLSPMFIGHYGQRALNMAVLAASIDHYETIKQDDGFGLD